MVSSPRSEVVRQGEVGVHHVWSRCVRRVFLWGIDPLTGRDDTHRRDWNGHFQQRLTGLFGVEMAFHTELSNHLQASNRNKDNPTNENNNIGFRVVSP